MPPKIRDLIRTLKAAGFADRGGRGGHRNFRHPAGARVTVSGGADADAKPYQQRDVARAIEETQR